MKKTIALLVILLVVAAIAWKTWKLDADTAPPAASVSLTQSLPPSSVLSVRPQSPSASPSARYASNGSLPQKRPVSDNLAQFRARKNYAALMARLQSQPDTPESLYLKAAIYARCATGRVYGGTSAPESRTAKREKFVASISQGAKDQAQRIDAYDRLMSDPCVGLDLGKFDANALQSMLSAAADAGDVHAQAWLTADQIEHRTPAEDGKPTHGDTMTAVNFDVLRGLLATGDADVLRYLSGPLASTLEHGEIRLDGDSFDPRAMHSALQLLACDAGAECGTDSPALLEACAMRGRCGASNLYDYVYFYDNSPNDSQLLDGYRQSLAQMLASGDFSRLTLSPVDPVPGYTFMFGDPRP